LCHYQNKAIKMIGLKCIIISFILLLFQQSNAQNEIWNKATLSTSLPATSYSIDKIVTDNFNNKYLISFEEKDSIINDLLSQLNIISLHKYNENNVFLWRKKVATSDYKNITYQVIFETDKRKKISIAFNFKNKVEIEGQYYTSQGDYDGIFVNYDLNGILKAVEQFGGPCTDSISDIDYNDDGSFFIAFNYGSNTSYSDHDCSFNFKNILFPKNANNTNYLFAKLNNEEDIIWHQKGTIPYKSNISKLSVHKNLLYIFGSVRASAVEDFHGIDVSFPYSLDVPHYIAQFDTSGNVNWIRYLGLNGDLTTLQISSLAVNKTSATISLNCITNDNGKFNNLVVENSTNLSGVAFSSVDHFVVNYNHFGEVNWGSSSKSYGWSYATDVISYTNNSTLITGYLENDLLFANDTIFSQGGNDIFVACYNANGEEQWIKTAGGQGNDTANSIALDQQGRIYVCGGTSSHPVTFGNITVEPPHPNNVFLARLSDDPILNIIPINTNQNQTTVYPNPANKQLWLQQNANKQTIKNLLMYDVQGNLINQTFKTTNAAINVEHLATGIYFLNIVYVNGTQQTIKWCKQ